jgi:hypothetical protein
MSCGILVNKSGGYYQQGKPYGMDAKVFVAAKYLNHKERLNEMRPVMSKVALECHFCKTFVVKIEHELKENSHILAPGEITLACGLLIGPRSSSMSDEEIFILCLLYWQDPTWSQKAMYIGCFVVWGQSC